MRSILPKKIDGIYCRTRDLVVDEYNLRPVRFFVIAFLVVIVLGVTAFFEPIKASIGLQIDQYRLQQKYDNFRTLTKQRHDSPGSDKYFSGQYEVVPSSESVDLSQNNQFKNADIFVASAAQGTDNNSVQLASTAAGVQTDNKPTISQRDTNGKAGLYKISAQDKKSKAVVAEETIAWGVLAFNPDYSIYPTNTTAALAMAVLDDRGKMVCDAAVKLEITDPNGNKRILSTKNELVLVNRACLVYGATSEPDYVADYKTTIPGEYQVVMTAEVGGGKRTLHDKFQVKADQPFYLQRVGATRTYPNAEYVYQLNFQPKVDNRYSVTETVPAEFVVSETNAKISTEGSVKKLTWQIDAKTGVDQALQFAFKGPLLSPHLYTFGPAEVKPEIQFATDLSPWKELRSWQIASDAQNTNTWDGSASALWSNGANWSTNLAPGAGDDLVFPASAANYSNTNDMGDNFLVNSITFNDTGYTLAGNSIILGQGLAGITDNATSGGNTISLNIQADAIRWVTVSNSGESLTISGAIAGVGGITKEGVGKAIFSGGNTYGGVTKVNGGVLSARHNTALGTIGGATEVVGEAALELQGTIAIGREALTLRGYGVSSGGALRNIQDNNSFAGLITLAGIAEIASNSGTLTLSGGVTGTIPLVYDGAGNITFTSAPIGTASGVVTKNGAGTVTYNFPNTYTGLTTINAGSLVYGVDNALLSGAVTVNGGTLDIATFSDMVGTVTLGTLAGGSGTITGSTGVLSSAAYTVYAGTISAIIAGDAGTLTKSTPGTVTLTKANLFSGATTVSAGTLKIQNSTALGVIDGITTVTSGATLQIDGSGLSIPEFITFSGVGVLNAGAIKNSTGNNTITGLLTLAAASMIKSDASTTLTVATSGATGAFTLTVDGAGHTTFSTGQIATSTGGVIKNGSGTLTLNAYNPYTGATTINYGQIVLSGNGAISLSTTMTVNSGGSLVVDNSSTVTDRLADSLALNMAGGDLDFYGSSSTNVNSIAGILTLTSGQNRITVYPGTGGYTIVRFASLVRTAGASALVRGVSFGATPAANVSTLMFTTAPTLLGDDGISGTPTLSVLQGFFGDNSTTGTGTDMVTYGRGNSNGLRLLNGAGFSNEYTTNLGITNANVKLSAATNAVTSQINSLVLNSGASITDAGSAQTMTFMSGNILNQSAGSSIAGANTTLAAGAVEFVTRVVEDLTISAAITTSGGLTKSGSGTLTFSTAKTYTGLTAVNRGTLLYGVNDAISSGNVTVDEATLNIVTYTDTVGVVTLQGGTITGTSGVLTATSYSVRDGTISAIIAGSGALTKVNTATNVESEVTLTRNNTYTGATTITSGILKLGAAGDGTNTPLGTVAGNATIASGASLDLNGFTLGTSEAITDARGTGTALTGAIVNTSGTPATYNGAITLGAAMRVSSDYGKITLGGTINGAAALTVGGYSDIDVTGAITTSASAMIKDGFGTYTPSNSGSTYAVATNITVGTLKLGSAGSGANGPLGTIAANTVVSDAATLDLNGFTLATAEPLNIRGAGSGTGDFAAGALVNSSASSVTYSGLLTLAAATTVKANSGTINLSHAGTITGPGFALTLAGSGTGTLTSIVGTVAGTLIKLDSGNWTLSGVSTFTGTSIIYQGTIKLGAAGDVTNTPLGTIGAGTTVFSGGVLDLSGFTLGTAEGLTVNGFGIAGGGAVINNSGSATGYSGTRALGSDSRTTNSGAGLLTLSGIQSGAFESRYGGAGNITVSVAIAATASSLLKDGAGTLNLTAANGHTGTTTVNAGTLAEGVISALSSGGVTVNGGIFDMATFTDTVGAVILTGGLITGSSGVLTATGYTVEHGTISAIIAGAVTMTKNTNGDVIMTAAETYSGATTINAGSIELSGSGTAVSSSFTINLGGTLTLNNSSTNVASRIGDASVVTMNGGSFDFKGSSSAIAAETIGQLLFSTGHNTVTVTPGAGGSTTLTVANNPGFNRTAGASVLFRGTSFGSAPAANISTLMFTTAPTVIGGGGASSTTTISVIKGAFGDSSLTGTGSDMVTYNLGNANGLRLLNGAGFSGEYAANLGTANANVKLTADTAATTTNTNSLVLNGFAVTNATVTLPIASASLAGNILIATAHNIAGANTVLGITTFELNILTNATSTISATIGTATTGSVTLSGSGNVTLSAANAYTSTTFINNATLTAGAANALSSGGVTVVGGTYNMNANADSVGAITTTAGIVTTGAATLTTTGTFTSVANANKSSTVSGTVALPAAAVFNIGDGLVDNDAVVSAVLTVAGTSLTKSTGAGVLVFSGDNTYAGSTTVGAGTLRLGTAGGGTNTPLGTTAGATIVSSGFTLDLNGFTLGTAEGLTISGTGIGANGALNNTSSTAVTYSGLLILGAAATVTSNYGDITLSNAGNITGTGFALTLSGAGNGTLTGNLNTSTAGSLVKTLLGTWTVSGSSTFTGVTTITTGVLKLGAAGGATNTPLGTIGTGTTIASGAMLDLNGFTLGTAEALTSVSGTGIANAGAITTNAAGSTSYSGAITMAVASRIVNFGAGTFSISGALAGNFALTTVNAPGGITQTSASVWSGTGTLVVEGYGTTNLAGQNSTSGLMTVSAGTLQVGAAGGAANTPLGTIAGGVTVSAGGTLDLSTFVVGGATTWEPLTLNGTGLKNAGALISTAAGTNNFGATAFGSSARIINNGAGTITIVGAASGAFNWVIGGSGPTTFSTVLPATAISITKYDAGTLTLTGANLYTGATRVNGGTFQYAASATTLVGTALTVAGGTFDFNGSTDTIGAVTLMSGAITDSNVTPGALTGTAYTLYGGTISGVLAGALAMTKSTSATVSVSKAISNTGTISVNAGTFQTFASNMIADTAAVTAAGGTFDIGANTETVAAVTLTSGSIIGAGTLTGTSYAFAAGTASVILAGAVNLTKTTAGTVTLSGVNTYTGITTISSGILSVGTIGNGSVAGNLGAAPAAAANIVSNTGTGTLQYTGTTASTDRNITTTTAITLIIDISSPTAALTISGTTTVTTGLLTKVGPGTLILSGANGHTGLTSALAGTLKYGIANALSAGAVTVNNGTFDLNNFSDSVGTTTLVNGGQIIDSGGSTEVLTSTATFALQSGKVSARLGSAVAAGISKTTTDRVILSGDNTFTSTTIALSAGALNLQSNNSLGASGTSQTLTITSGAMLELQNTITLPSTKAITFSGTGVNNGGAIRNISDSNIIQAAIAQGASGTRVNSDSGTLTLNGNITGTARSITLGGTGNITHTGTIATTSGTVTKDGTGTLALMTANTYTGITTINAGVVNIQNNTSLGTTANGTTVADGAALEIQGTISVGSGETLNLSGTGISNNGALRNISDSNTWQGAVTLSATSSVGSDSGTLTISGAITGSGSIGLTKVGAATVSVATTNVGGDLAISAGTLSAAGTITVGGNWSNSGTFTAGSATVTLNGSATQTLSGTMTGSSAFNTLTVTNASGTNAADCERTSFVPSIDFAAAATATNMTFVTASTRVEFNTGSTYTFTDINWNGQATGTKLYFRNSAASGTWLLKVTGTQTAVSHINVSRSDASVAGGSTIAANDTTNTDCTNNTNWNFGGNVAPNSPSSLAQTRTNDVVLATGDWTNETSVKFTATASDTDNPDTLQLCVEAIAIASSFADTDTNCGTLTAYSGTPISITVTLTGLVTGTEYKWQARVKDTAAAASAWVGYGANGASRDFGVDTSACSIATIYDGTSAGVDASYNDSSVTSLSGNWDAFTCTVSGLQKYEYSVGVTAGGTTIKGWTDNSVTASVTSTSLTLHTNENYFVNVRATDNAGNVSSVASSNGQQVLPSLSFSMGANTLTFTNLNSTNNRLDTQTVSLTTSTNAYGGYVISQYAGGLLTDGSNNIPMFSAGSYASPASWGAGSCSGTSCGYGYTSNDTTIQGSNLFSGGTLYAPFSQTVPGDIVADHTTAIDGSTGAVSNESFTITHKVAVTGLQAAKTYQATVYYIVTGTF